MEMGTEGWASNQLLEFGFTVGEISPPPQYTTGKTLFKKKKSFLKKVYLTILNAKIHGFS